MEATKKVLVGTIIEGTLELAVTRLAELVNCPPRLVALQVERIYSNQCGLRRTQIVFVRILVNLTDCFFEIEFHIPSSLKETSKGYQVRTRTVRGIGYWDRDHLGIEEPKSGQFGVPRGYIEFKKSYWREMGIPFEIADWQ